MTFNPSHHPLSGRRFWLTFAAAWTGLFLVEEVIFQITGAPSLPAAVIGSGVGVGPMALNAAILVNLFRRMTWEPKPALLAVHALLATGFAFGSSGLGILIRSIENWFKSGTFAPERWVFEYFVWETLMAGMIYGAFAGICFAFVASWSVREHEARIARELALRTEAELKALRAQVNPHFLFNTLHTLLSLVRHDPKAAENALEQFGDLLRYALDTQKNGEEVPLADEMGFVENYLALESLRLGDRLQVDVDIDKAILSEPVPAFTIQPLVENAIRHGIAPRAGGGKLSIEGSSDEGQVRIAVADDGLGDQHHHCDSTDGLGLKLVRERLAALHGADSQLSVETGNGGGFTVRLSWPVRGGV